MNNLKYLTKGIFEVGSSGIVDIDRLNNCFECRQVSIFSLKEMEHLDIGSVEFLQEAIDRALSNSKLGYVVNQEDLDLTKKSFLMEEGDRFAIMLIRRGTISEIAANPKVENVLFSFDTSKQEFDSYEAETFLFDYDEQILISNVFNDYTLVEFYSSFNINLPEQILVKT